MRLTVPLRNTSTTSESTGGSSRAGPSAVSTPRPPPKKPRMQEPSRSDKRSTGRANTQFDKGKGRATGPVVEEDLTTPRTTATRSSRPQANSSQTPARRRHVSDQRTDVLPFESDVSEDEDGAAVRFEWDQYSNGT